MSDHSTQAMTPKEPPKTCGTCDHADPYALSCDICGKSRRFQVGYEEKACGYWVKGTDALEQRFHQLEQVAQEMWAFFRIISDELGIEASFTHGATKEVWSLSTFHERLEALGVNVDGDQDN